MRRWWIPLIGFVICAGLMTWNASIYFGHAHGHGFNLFAACWAGVVAIWNLWMMGKAT